MAKSWYTIAVCLTGALVVYLQLSGWCSSTYDRVRDVPNNVRNNPGSYRSHYQMNYIHLGGK